MVIEKLHRIPLLAWLISISLWVFDVNAGAQNSAGITADNATQISSFSQLSVQSGSNFVRVASDYLPVIIDYVPDTAFGPIPVTKVMGDSLFNLTAPTESSVAQLDVLSATKTYADKLGYFDAGVKIAYHFNFPKKKQFKDSKLF